jgi:hypothetical protein
VAPKASQSEEPYLPAPSIIVRDIREILMASQSEEPYLPAPSTIVRDIREILLDGPSERRYVPPHGIRSHRLHHRLAQLVRRRPRAQEEAHRMEQAAVVVRLRDGARRGERCGGRESVEISRAHAG